MECSTLTSSSCCPLLPLAYLFRPDLDPLSLLPLGSAPGTGGLALLVALDLLVQGLHQLLVVRVSGRGTDFLVPFGGKPGGAGRNVCWKVGRGRTREREGLAGAKPFWMVYLHDSMQHTSQLRSLEAVGLHQVFGDSFLAVLQAAVQG